MKVPSEPLRPAVVLPKDARPIPKERLNALPSSGLSLDNILTTRLTTGLELHDRYPGSGRDISLRNVAEDIRKLAETDNMFNDPQPSKKLRFLTALVSPLTCFGGGGRGMVGTSETVLKNDLLDLNLKHPDAIIRATNMEAARCAKTAVDVTHIPKDDIAARATANRKYTICAERYHNALQAELARTAPATVA